MSSKISEIQFQMRLIEQGISLILGLKNKTEFNKSKKN